MEKYWKVFWAVVVSAAFLIVLAIIWPIAKLVYGDAIQKHKATVVLHTRAKVLGNESAQDQVKSRGVHSDAKDDLTSSRLRVAGAHLDQESTEMMVRETPYQDRFLRSVAWFYEARVGSKALTGKKELLILGTPVRVLFPEQTMLKEGFSEVLVRINILQPDGTERPGYVRVSRVSRKGQKQQSKFGGWWSVPIPEGSKMVVQKSVTLKPGQESEWLAFPVPPGCRYDFRSKENEVLRIRINGDEPFECIAGKGFDGPKLIGSARVKVQLSPLAKEPQNVRFLIEKA